MTDSDKPFACNVPGCGQVSSSVQPRVKMEVWLL